jgi:hypothetical protein
MLVLGDALEVVDSTDLRGRVRRFAVPALVAVCVMVVGQDAGAFQIGNAAAHFCHERITLDGFRQTNLSEPLALAKTNLPTDAAWVKFADYLEDAIGIPRDLPLAGKLVLVTLFVGVRYPDQAGYAVYDLQHLRELHLAADGQEEHFLRALNHDGPEGDALAVAAGREYIWSILDEAREAYFLDPDADRTIEVKVWFPYYGDVDILVWAPLFHLGKALHALQDSFAHTIRSEDTLNIYAVGNFVEGLSTKFDERRDGPRHSDFMDNCRNPEVAPLVESATTATAELLVAAVEYFRLGRTHGVEEVLDRWLTYAPGCGYDEGYCDSIWATYMKRDPTLAVFSCAAPGPVLVGDRTADWTWIFCLLVLLGWRRQSPG